MNYKYIMINKLTIKGKYLRTKEARGKFDMGKSIRYRAKEVRKRETIGYWQLDTIVSSIGKYKA